jgi:hypothetical protein
LIDPRKRVIEVAALKRRKIIDMQIHSVGIDLGKTTFHLVALGAAGKVIVWKRRLRLGNADALPLSRTTTTD